jgi:hypothetical protein
MEPATEPEQDFKYYESRAVGAVAAAEAAEGAGCEGSTA